MSQKSPDNYAESTVFSFGLKCSLCCWFIAVVMPSWHLFCCYTEKKIPGRFDMPDEISAQEIVSFFYFLMSLKFLFFIFTKFQTILNSCFSVDIKLMLFFSLFEKPKHVSFQTRDPLIHTMKPTFMNFFKEILPCFFK